jgi:hypothetical protein
MGARAASFGRAHSLPARLLPPQCLLRAALHLLAQLRPEDFPSLVIHTGLSMLEPSAAWVDAYGIIKMGALEGVLGHLSDLQKWGAAVDHAALINFAFLSLTNEGEAERAAP